jgi:hypothetical protein
LNAYSFPGIIRITKSKSSRLGGHIALMRTYCIQVILKEPGEKKPLGKPTLRRG